MKKAVILGSGLSIREGVTPLKSIPYVDIPSWPVGSVKGHKGVLDKYEDLWVLRGRAHLYEGFTWEQACFPTKYLAENGIEELIITNAAGGINSNFEIGYVMIINDHINLAPSPLFGKNISELGTRFPDMSEPYSKEMIESAERIFNESKICFHKGTYVCVTGPNLETPAEYKFLKIIGGDAVGMSTVPEVIVARHMNMQCFAVSVITDLGIEGKIEKVTHEEIQQAAKKAQPNLITLIKKIIN